MEEEVVVEEGEKELEVADQVEEVETPTEIEETEESQEEVIQEENVEEQEEKVQEEAEEVKQSEEDNRAARLARIKAEKEAEERAEKIRKEAFELGKAQGQIASYVGKVNPYTGSEIKDEYDAKEYLDMFELESKGQDPVIGYRELQKERMREEAKKQIEVSEQERQRQWFEKDTRDFLEEYSQDKLDELMKDEDFKAFADGKVGQAPLADIYVSYKKFISKYQKKASETAKTLIANNVASPGKISEGDAEIEDWTTMSKDKFEKYVQKAMDGELKNL